MSEQDQSASPLPRRNVIAAAVATVVAVIVGVIGVVFWQSEQSDGPQGQEPPAAAAPGEPVVQRLADMPAGTADAHRSGAENAASDQIPEAATADSSASSAYPPAPGTELLPPSFDIIRVSPDGRAVIAGSAAPGAQVTISAGKTKIGTVTADDKGDWVLVPDTPIPSGDQILSLQAESGSSGMITSNQSAIISIPERPDEEVLVAIAEPDAPTRQLAQGSGSNVVLVPADKPFVSVAAIDLTLAGEAASDSAGSNMVIFSGRAPAGSRVNLYLDDQFIGTTSAKKSGVWLLRSNMAVSEGAHRLRVDQVGAAGQVLLRAEVQFVRQATGSLSISAQQVHILRGNYLWQIARNLFGAGHAFSYIYNENQDQIRDPDLIYPGQIFSIPVARTTDRAP